MAKKNSMGELSHVGMTQCFFCLKEIGIALDKRLRDSLPHKAVYDMAPCDQCKKYMDMGIILIGVRESDMERVQREQGEHASKYEFTSPRNIPPFIPNPYRTGHWHVVSEDFIRRNIASPNLVEQIIRVRWAFIPEWMGAQLDTFAKETGVPTGE